MLQARRYTQIMPQTISKSFHLSLFCNLVSDFLEQELNYWKVGGIVSQSSLENWTELKENSSHVKGKPDGGANGVVHVIDV